MIKLLLFTMLAATTFQACAKGCLKCSSEDGCIIPDVTKLYKLNDDTAEQVVKDGCVLVNFEGNCQACLPGKYLDTATDSCLVPGELIDNCEMYNSATACGVCKKDFYLDSGSSACTAVETSITNCKYYNTAVKCLSCEEGYLLDSEAVGCIANPNIDNCVSYSFVNCSSCKAGLVRTLNGYLDAWRSVDGSSAKAAVALLAGGNYSGFASQTACETALASNCLTFETGLNKCTACNAGYFITDENLCVAYPDEKLANCKDYSSATNCINCISAHYFVQGVCTAIAADSLKEFCVEYNTASSSVQCSKCSDNYFLSNNSCSERDKSKDNKIANCGTKSSTSDKCAACSGTMILTGDGLECKSAIANCASYNTVNSGQDLTCNVCDSGFYKKTNVVTADSNTPPTECIAGEVENCATYGSGVTNCLTCKNGFILQGTTCQANNTIAGCTVYNSTNLYQCNTCTNNANFNFKITNRCNTIINQVANCLEHDGGTLASPTCGVCNVGYHKESSTSCTKINISNCLELNPSNSSKCAKCAAGYALAEDSESCMQALSYVTTNCAQNETYVDNSVVVDTVKCNKCAEHAYSLDFQNMYICVENTNIKQFVNTFTTTVDNCLKYDDSGHCYQCNPNETKKFLKGTGAAATCETECSATLPQYDRIKLDSSGSTPNIVLEVDQFNVCLADSTGVLMKAPDVSIEAGTNIPIKCLPDIGNAKGFFPVISIGEANYSIVDPDSDTYPYMPSPLAYFPEVTCEDKDTTHTINGANSDTIADDACAYYITQSDPNFICLRCPFGKVGTIDTTAAHGHITGCATDNSFDTTTRYYNIHPTWEVFFSVHKCTDAAKIPVLAVNSANAGAAADATPIGFTRWADPATSNSWASATGTGKPLFCDTYAAGMLSLNTSAYNPVANCALATLYVQEDGTNNYSSNAYSLNCAACKPGYKSTAQGVAPEDVIITQCDAIDHCKAGGKLANTCEECDTGYVLLYNTTNSEIEFGANVECLSVPAADQAKYENCLAAEKEGSTTTAKECKVCKKGYYLNLDKHCESINSAQCKSGQFRKNAAFFKNTVAEYEMYLRGQGVGCNECEASHSALKITGNYDLCVSSSWLQTKVDTIAVTDTNYIPFCKHYNTDDTDPVKCAECDANYVIHGTSDPPSGEKCYSATTLQNCKIAKSASECILCVNDTFGLVNNACTAGNIANCAKYNFDTLENQVKCTQCNPGFYLSTSNNSCLPGHIPNCTRFENNNKSRCAVCNDGHKIASISNNEVYCYPVSAELACSDYNITTNNTFGANINCTACTNKQTHLLVEPSGTEDQTICMDFVPVSNCETYNVGSTLSNSTFKCNKCAETFYYDSDSNACVARVNVPAKCSSYNTTKDECNTCGQDSYLFNSKKECRDYPKGILGCEEYSDAQTCTKCQPERYLLENACPKADPVIPDCSYYSAKTTCSSCKSTYVLVNNECKKANATGCVTYASIDACATCSALSGLENSNSIVNCVNKSKNGCDIVSDNSPYNCTQCSNGFYLKDGECANPTTTIENCLKYDSGDTCEQCKEGYALATNKKSCINSGVIGSHIPTGCGVANAVSEPICSRCGPAYHFVQDSCAKQCTGDDADGCLICDKVDGDKCLVCVSGYHQNKDGKCIKDSKPTDPDGEDSDDSAGILKTLIVMVVSLMVIAH